MSIKDKDIHKRRSLQFKIMTLENKLINYKIQLEQLEATLDLNLVDLQSRIDQIALGVKNKGIYAILPTYYDVYKYINKIGNTTGRCPTCARKLTTTLYYKKLNDDYECTVDTNLLVDDQYNTFTLFDLDEHVFLKLDDDSLYIIDVNVYFIKW